MTVNGYVVLYRKRRAIFKTVEELGVLSYDDFLRNFGAAFETHTSHCLILGSDAAKSVKEHFQQVRLAEKWDSYTAISFDDIINVSPDEMTKE